MSMQGARALHNKAVVYILDTCAPGTAERAGINVMNRVAQEGIATFLIAPITAEEAAGMRLSCNEVISIPELGKLESLYDVMRGRLLAFLKLCRALYDMRFEFEDVVVHTHGQTAGFWGRWAAWCVGIGHTIHTVYRFSFAPGMKAYQWWVAYVVEYLTSWVTSEYICLSAKDRSVGIQYLPFFAKRCVVIRPSIDWQEFYAPVANARPSMSPIVVGTVLGTSVDQEQTVYTFLRLVQKLQIMGVPVRGEIIGEGAWRWRVTQWLADHDLESAVRILGWQGQSAAVIKTWHLFVSCSKSEVPSTGVVQARLSWVPVVAYHAAWVDEIIRNEKSGLLVPVGDEVALFKEVYRVIIDRPLYERLASYQENLHEYSEVAVGTSHVKLYKNIAG